MSGAQNSWIQKVPQELLQPASNQESLKVLLVQLVRFKTVHEQSGNRKEDLTLLGQINLDTIKGANTKVHFDPRPGAHETVKGKKNITKIDIGKETPLARIEVVLPSNDGKNLLTFAGLFYVVGSGSRLKFGLVDEIELSIESTEAIKHHRQTPPGRQSYGQYTSDIRILKD